MMKPSTLNLQFIASLSPEQAKELLIFITKSQQLFPRSLEGFRKDLHNYVFDFLTIDEAEKLFNENST